jgi:hypothetical protein
MSGDKITIIICSINPERCNKTLENIRETIGVDYETIVFDNRNTGWGICKVYNHCAEKAKAPYLCFMHEDVLLGTKGWGKMLVDFAEQVPDCGVIGFAGGLRVLKNFVSWVSGETRMNVYDTIGKGREDWKLDYKRYLYINPKDESASQVLCLDGLFQFVKKSVWKEIRYDEDIYTGFHGYDVDFSFAVSQKYKNYVLYDVDVFHDSPGKTNKEYMNSMCAFQIKWKQFLPVFLEKPPSRLRMMTLELREGFVFLDEMKKATYSSLKVFRQMCKVNSVLYLCLFFFCWFLRNTKGMVKKIMFCDMKL